MSLSYNTTTTERKTYPYLVPNTYVRIPDSEMTALRDIFASAAVQGDSAARRSELAALQAALDPRGVLGPRLGGDYDKDDDE